MTNSKLKKFQGNMFVALILVIICFLYFCNVKLVWIDRKPSDFWAYLYLTIFNIFAFMLVWSLGVSIFTDPVNDFCLEYFYKLTGYFLDDPEQKKKKYCLICHIFKPERTHHCSACNRCVLNMDHHCPWLGNCIGFANRKFFILLLFYVNVTTWLVALGMISEIFNIFISVKNMLGGDETVEIQWFSDFFIVAAFCLDVTAMVVIGIFFKFHLDLLFMNSTTLENLERKRSSPTPNSNTYDMGQYYNFVQVFGSQTAMWPFPFFLDDSRPVGDGVIWPQRVQADNTTDTGTKPFQFQSSQPLASPQGPNGFSSFNNKNGFDSFRNPKISTATTATTATTTTIGQGGGNSYGQQQQQQQQQFGQGIQYNQAPQHLNQFQQGNLQGQNYYRPMA